MPFYVFHILRGPSSMDSCSISSLHCSPFLALSLADRLFFTARLTTHPTHRLCAGPSRFGHLEGAACCGRFNLAYKLPSFRV